MAESIAWCLPRPRPNRYIGGVPLHFEKKLLRELGMTPDAKILQPFGGAGEYGIRCDVQVSVEPDVLADAHALPFRDNVFDLVFLDPPYGNEYSRSLYGTGVLKPLTYLNEAVRVCREGGFVVTYHMLSLPVPPHTILEKRVLVETRPWHAARIVHINRKDTEQYHARGIAQGKAACPTCDLAYRKDDNS